MIFWICPSNLLYFIFHSIYIFFLLSNQWKPDRLQYMLLIGDTTLKLYVHSIDKLHAAKQWTDMKIYSKICHRPISIEFRRKIQFHFAKQFFNQSGQIETAKQTNKAQYCLPSFYCWFISVGRPRVGDPHTSKRNAIVYFAIEP